MRTKIVLLIILFVGFVVCLYEADVKMRKLAEACHQIRDSLNVVTARYDKLSSKYKALDDSLDRQIAFTNTVIGQLNTALSPVKVAIDDNLNQDWKALPDSGKIQSCDSLREYVKVYRVEQERIDSLKDQQIIACAKQSYMRELQIEQCAQAYHEVATIANSSLSYGEACSGELTKASKKLKHQVFWNKVLVGVTAVLGAYTVGHLVH